jgi:hypothetical protein
MVSATRDRLTADEAVRGFLLQRRDAAAKSGQRLSK